MSRLAINGGTPIRTKPFPAWPVFDDHEKAALNRILESGNWGTLGPAVKNFSNRFAKYQQSRYGIAVVNGTVALEVIMRGLGIGYGDEVILPPFTFYATASAIIAVGATPVFCDIQADSYSIDPEKLNEVITPATKAVIAVHVGGRPCDMDRILEVAAQYKIHVIEDSAQAHGSEWENKRTGSMGIAGGFSFQGSKNLCCGEGGFIATNNESLYEKCWSIHNSGRSLDANAEFAYYSIATNARMSEWEAAILNSQMDRLDIQIAKREENAAYLNKRLSEIPCIMPLFQDSRITRNSYHLYIFKFLSEHCNGLTRTQFIKALCAEGIPCSQGYGSLNKIPVFQSEEFRRITGSKIDYQGLVFENADKASNFEAVWLYHAVLLGEKNDMNDIVDAVIKVYENSKQLLTADVEL